MGTIEHLTLLRQLATGLPRRFPDLALLASPEVWKEVSKQAGPDLLRPPPAMESC